MSSVKFHTIPGHDSAVKGILQDPVNGPSFETISALCTVSQIITPSCYGSLIYILIIIQVHDIRYHGILGFVDLEGFSVAYSLISKAWSSLVAVLQSFFFHSSQNLTRKTDRVVFVHPLNDTLDQGTKRPVYKRLRYADNVHVIFLEHTLVYNGFLLITGESGVFPDQYHINRV